MRIVGVSAACVVWLVTATAWAQGEEPEAEPAEEDAAGEADEAGGPDEAEGSETPEPEAEGEADEDAGEAETGEADAPDFPPEATPAVPVEGEIFSIEDANAERALPDYDGREDETTPGEVLLWVPRILFSPLYLVSEFLIRRPLGAVVTAFEEEEIPEKIVELFTFGPNGETLVVPTAFADFGFRPTIGIYFRTKDFLVPNHTLLANANFGGIDYLSASLAERYSGEDDQWQLQIQGQMTTRADGLFYGLGPNSLDDNRSRYAYDVRKAEIGGEGYYYRSSMIEGWGGVRSVDFRGEDVCCDDPTVQEQVLAMVFDPAPPGLGGYDITHFGVRASLDTRPERPEPGSGLRVSGLLEYATAIDGSDTSWLRYGGSAGVYWDVSDWQHVVSLSVWTQFADAIDGEVPFTEQIDMSESGAPGIRDDRDVGPMRGFNEGRVMGESAVAATFEYRWPVWMWLDGSFHASVGNAFDGKLDGFGFGDNDEFEDRLRLSTGLGLRTTDSRDSSFDLIVGIGTETFGRGGAVESVRLAIGSTQSF